MIDKEGETEYTVVEYKTTTDAHGVLSTKDKRLASIMALAKSIARSPIIAVAVIDAPVNDKLTYVLNK